MSSALSDEEKKRFIKALEEDMEFRHAVMGLLGFREILDSIMELRRGQQRLEERMVKLEERFAELEERFAKLEERFAKLEERVTRLEERVTRLEERFAELEERFVQLEERFAKLEERFAKLEERVTRLEERVTRLEEAFIELKRTVAVIGHRFGVISEGGLRAALWFVVEEKLGVASVSKKTLYDEDGIVYGHPAVVDIDVAVTDKKHIVIEIKSRIGRGDVLELHRIGVLYEKKTGVKPMLVIIGGYLERGVRELAARMGVELLPAVPGVDEYMV